MDIHTYIYTVHTEPSHKRMERTSNASMQPRYPRALATATGVSPPPPGMVGSAPFRSSSRTASVQPQRLAR